VALRVAPRGAFTLRSSCRVGLVVDRRLNVYRAFHKSVTL
jgi:hypothetical protein